MTIRGQLYFTIYNLSGLLNAELRLEGLLLEAVKAAALAA